MRLVLGIALILSVASVALAGFVPCIHNDPRLVKWSSWANKPSAASASVTIAANERVLLDESPPLLATLTIAGFLVVDPSPNASITLQASDIVIEDGGRFIAGEAQLNCRLEGSFEIVLFGEPQKDVSPRGVGTKSIGVLSGGQLDIHGQYRKVTWTQLAATANVGATSITLVEPVDWRVGELIVIATTDFEQSDISLLAVFPHQTELRNITGVSSDGKTISFAEPLKFMHYGEIWSQGGDSIDLRGEVGLLTRNIKFRGDTSGTAGTAKWGAHMMCLNGGEMRIEGVEITAAGQAGELGRYPIHYHLAGNQSMSYTRRNAIYNTFQRCVTIHGTSYVTVKDNVAYNSHGHCYFIEDGNEEGNVFDHNLGIWAEIHRTLLTSDLEPSIFWITNPRNHFYKNAAVGGKFGFWYAMPFNPLGPAKPIDGSHPNVLNRYMISGDFIGNRAHSSESGLFIDRGQQNEQGDVFNLTNYFPTNFTNLMGFIDLNSLKARLPVDQWHNIGEPTPAVFEDFTAYKNSDVAVWGRGAFLHFKNMKLADNQVGCSFPDHANLITDSVIVGETNNIGNLSPLFVEEAGRTRPMRYIPDVPIIGYRSYDAGGGDSAINLRFYNFKDFTFPSSANGAFFNMSGRVRKSGAISGQIGPNVLSPANRWYNLKFIDVDNPIYFYEQIPTFENGTLTWVDTYNNDAAMKGIVNVDGDGSITGTCGTYIVGTGKHLRHAGCTAKPAWGAHTCPSANQPAFRTIRISEIQERAVLVSRSAALNERLGITRLHDGVHDVVEPTRLPTGGSAYGELIRFSWSTNIAVNQDWFFTPGNDKMWMLGFRMTVQLRKGEYVRFALPFAPHTVFHATATDGTNFTQVASYNELKQNTFFTDITRNITYFHIESASFENWDWFLGTPVLIPSTYINVIAQCPGNDCWTYFDIAGLPQPAPTAPFAESCDRTLASRTFAETSRSFIYASSEGGWLSSTWIPTSSHAGNAVSQPDHTLLITLSQVTSTSSLYSVFTLSPMMTVGFTHLEFQIKLYPGFSVNTFGVIFSCDLQNIITVRSPFYTNWKVISSEDWTTVRIPLADLNATLALPAFGFGTALPSPTKFYVDNIALVKYNLGSGNPAHFPPTVPATSQQSSYVLGKDYYPQGWELSETIVTNNPPDSPPGMNPPSLGAATWPSLILILAALFSCFVSRLP